MYLVNQNTEKVEKKEFPRPDTPLFDLLSEDEETKKKTLKKWNLFNKWLIIPLYRIYLLPLFGLGKIFLLLQTEGRISGKKRYTPLEYRKVDGIVTVVSSRGNESGWMKNIRKSPDKVKVRIGFHKYKPKIEIIDDELSKEQFYNYYVSHYGSSAKFLFGWDPKTDEIESSDFSKLIQGTTVVKFIQ
jgi:deazaflavin-dependent oxidoreductase (nitroreductase family)